MSVLSRAILSIGMVLFLATSSFAAEWQWSTTLDSMVATETNAPPRAFLWIPPDCHQVRAVVVGQHNMLEEGILEHPHFRKEMAKLGIAEIWITPVLDIWQNATNNDTANQRFDAMLKALAEDSGYPELAFAPVIPIGHSAMASFPWNFAAWNPERTLAILSVKGDAPQTHLVGNGRPNADWSGRSIDGIPGLMVMGEYEWWEDRLDPALKFRAQHPSAPIAMLADAGRGHFDFSDALVDYLARFIRKAVEHRLPVNSRASQRGAAEKLSAGMEKGSVYSSAPASLRLPGRILLNPVNPRQGWRVDRWRKDAKPHAPAAPFGKFTGNTNEAFWAFDREMALLTERFAANARGKQPQMIGYVQDGKVLPQTPNSHEQVRLRFLPFADGITFKLEAAFLDSVAAGNNPAKWTGLTNGAPLSHATGGGAIRISRICGPVRQIRDDTFALSFYRMGMTDSRRTGEIWFMAEHPGDRKFKSAVQQAQMRVPVASREGAEQRIAFPAIPNQKAGIKSFELSATSDAGVPVCYYVREGPAEIDGNRLRFTKIPPRAKYPVKVTVVAWQYGRAFEPKLRSAMPVERTFEILE
jgi:hypothetical protein